MKIKNKKILPWETVFVIIVILFMILSNGSKTADLLAINAQAYTEYTFTPKVAEIEGKWHIKPRMELVGNYNDYQRHWMQVAWEISGYDKEFMYMLKGENGLLNHDRRSLVVSNGIREPSYGFCQIHAGYHPEIVNDPRFFSDPKWQLEQCYRLWKGGTKFYGYNHRAKSIQHFNFS